jgi:glycosyltransferase involved in cell wall biosynthesis
MPYTILSIAYPFTPVGPDATGGSEQILSSLDRYLVDKGHRSIVIAVEGSSVRGELIPSPKCHGTLNGEARYRGSRIHRRILLDTLDRYPIDLVHMHALDFHTYLPPSGVSTLATLHLPVDWYPEEIFSQRDRKLFLNCVSSSQNACCPKTNQMLPFVSNGIDLNAFHFRKRKQPWVLGLGRICPEKGYHLALEAARKAGVGMILAGELFPYREHISYFKKKIKPLLDSQRQFIGPVGPSERRELLSSASALLVPSLVAETSSLVTMEALASGTPVIAFRIGALPELVVHGKTGFLAKNWKEMASLLLRRSELKALDCREAVEQKNDFRVMGSRYISLYQSILKGPVSRMMALPTAQTSWLTDFA